MFIPTEKNGDMLDLIDCFCGSGTTLKAAHLNNRQWIGIDKSELAIKTTANKINSISSDLFVERPDIEIINIQQSPKS